MKRLFLVLFVFALLVVGYTQTTPQIGDIKGFKNRAIRTAFENIGSQTKTVSATWTFSAAPVFSAGATFGVDGTGTDVRFNSATSGDYMLWDASEEALTITGTNAQDALNVDDGNVDIADDIDVDGTTNLDVVDIDGATDLSVSSGTALTFGSTPDKIISAGSYSSKINLTEGSTREMVTVAGEMTEDDFLIGIGSYMRTTGEDGKGFGASFLVEATNTTGTPTVEGAQIMAFLGSVGGSEAAHLKTRGGDATAGMYALWLKTGANDNCVFDSGSRTAPLWVDNQCGGTHSGEEYGIFASTGGSQPDAFVGFETTSSGWDALFYFDETAYDQEPVVSGNITGGTKGYYLRVNINGTMYGIQLYAE